MSSANTARVRAIATVDRPTPRLSVAECVAAGHHSWAKRSHTNFAHATRNPREASGLIFAECRLCCSTLAVRR